MLDRTNKLYEIKRIGKLYVFKIAFAITLSYFLRFQMLANLSAELNIS